MKFFSSWDDACKVFDIRKEVYVDIDRYSTIYAHVSSVYSSEFRMQISNWEFKCDRKPEFNEFEKGYVLDELNHLTSAMLWSEYEDSLGSIRFHAYSLFQAAEQCDDLNTALALIDAYREQLIKSMSVVAKPA